MPACKQPVAQSADSHHVSTNALETASGSPINNKNAAMIPASTRNITRVSPFCFVSGTSEVYCWRPGLATRKGPLADPSELTGKIVHVIKAAGAGGGRAILLPTQLGEAIIHTDTTAPPASLNSEPHDHKRHEVIHDRGCQVWCDGNDAKRQPGDDTNGHESPGADRALGHSPEYPKRGRIRQNVPPTAMWKDVGDEC